MMNIFLYVTLLLTVVLSTIVLNSNKSELGISSSSAFALALLHTIAGVFCVKLFAGLESLSNPLNAGMSLFGALFILPASYWVGSRLTHRDLALVFDNFCLCVMIALMCVRCNCIVSGCCRGKVISGTDMFWPTRQVEILFWAVMLVWFLCKKKHGYIKGTLYPLMLMTYGIFRFLIEFLRDEASVLGIFHFGHIWAIISFFAGSAIYFTMTDASKVKNKRKR